MHDLGPRVALGKLEFKLQQQPRQNHLDLSNGKVPPWTGLVAVPKRQTTGIGLPSDKLVQVHSLVCVALAVASQRIEFLGSVNDGRVIGVMVAGPSDSGTGWDFSSIFERERH